MTRDGVAVRVNAVLWYRAEDPVSVVTTVENWQTRGDPGGRNGDARRDRPERPRSDAEGALGHQQAAAGAAERRLPEWGVIIDSVEIKDLDIPEQMQRAIAREAEAIREKRARIIKAEGEHEAARKLADAAATIVRRRARWNFAGCRR